MENVCAPASLVSIHMPHCISNPYRGDTTIPILLTEVSELGRGQMIYPRSHS